MDLDKRLRRMAGKTRADAAAGHRMPLIPDAAGVQAKGILRGCGGVQPRWLGRMQRRLAVRRKESAGREQSGLRAFTANRHRPVQWLKRVELAVGKRGEAADIESARSGVLKA